MMCDHPDYNMAWDVDIETAVESVRTEIRAIEERFEKLEAILLKMRETLDRVE
jgi:hypothetical protein